MKLAFQSIAWGQEIDDLPKVLETIRDAGYAGVEIGQRPEVFRRLGIPTSAALRQVLQGYGLELLGYSTGHLADRVEFCRDDPGVYLLAYRWEEKVIQEALAHQLRIAMHPRAFMPWRRMEDLLEVLAEHSDLPDLQVVLDTAHLYLAGDDPAIALGELLSVGEERLAVVHLKDWTSDYGRSLVRHSRGFTFLGSGEVDLPAVLNRLAEIRYSGWVVAELDNLWLDPVKAAYTNARWLHHELKIAPRTTAEGIPPAALTSASSRLLSAVSGFETTSNRRFSHFLARIAEIAQPPSDRFYAELVRAVSALIPAEEVSLWACGFVLNRLVPLAIKPEPPSQDLSNLPLLDQSMTGWALEMGTAAVGQDPAAPAPGREHYRTAVSRSRSSFLLSIPIYTSGSPNYPHLVLDIVLGPANKKSRDELVQMGAAIGQLISAAADRVFEAEASEAASSVNRLAGKFQTRTLNEFLSRFCLDVREEFIPCEGVSLWMPDSEGTKLELRAATKIRWAKSIPKEEHYYLSGQGFTGRVWKTKEVLFALDADRKRDHPSADEPRSWEMDNGGSLLIAPWLDNQQTVQVILRCANKLPTHHGSAEGIFTDDDASAVDAMGQAVLPQIRERLEEERRAENIGELAHELRRPIPAIIEQAENMLAAWGVPEQMYQPLHKIQAYAWELWLAKNNADVFREYPRAVSVAAAPTLLVQDVIRPLLTDLRPVFALYGASIAAVDYQALTGFPELWLDAPRIHLALANLLHNSLFFTPLERMGQLSIQFAYERGRTEFLLRIQDNGPGIERGAEEPVFRAGVHSRGHATNPGLGLWVVREILRAHGGDARAERFTGNRTGTEIVLSLPRRLTMYPPERRSS